MLIDLILDRKDGEESGEPYSAAAFYRAMLPYQSEFPDIIMPITRAFDNGTEEEVKLALCRYIVEQGYNGLLCGFICNREWLRDYDSERVRFEYHMESLYLCFETGSLTLEEYESERGKFYAEYMNKIKKPFMS